MKRKPPKRKIRQKGDKKKKIGQNVWNTVLCTCLTLFCCCCGHVPGTYPHITYAKHPTLCMPRKQLHVPPSNDVASSAPRRLPQIFTGGKLAVQDVLLFLGVNGGAYSGFCPFSRRTVPALLLHILYSLRSWALWSHILSINIGLRVAGCILLISRKRDAMW